MRYALARTSVRPGRNLGTSILRSVLALVLLVAGIDNAAAHRPSDSFLALERDAAGIRLQWDIALRDLEIALGLDADRDRRVTRGEVERRAGEIGAYALSRLQLSAAGQACATALESFDARKAADGAYARLQLVANCPPGKTIELGYDLFFDLDPTHRGLATVRDGGRESSFVLSSSDRRLSLDRGASSAWSTFGDFIVEGVWHIWIGFDHILFLLTLLLPAVLSLRHGHWQPADSLAGATVDTLKVVTAFTVAHSITLALAVLEVVSLPSRFVESVIALSVIVAAVNNLWPMFRGSRLLVPFGFGLIHGFGFATVLQDLGLSTGQFVVSLLGFNLGVELGQLAIVAAFLPIAFWLRETAFYRWGLLRLGSLAAAALATLWLSERLFDYQPLAMLASN